MAESSEKQCNGKLREMNVTWCLLRALLEMAVRTPQTLGSELWRGWEAKLEATDTMRSLAPIIGGGFCCLLGELPLDIGVPPWGFSSSIAISQSERENSRELKTLSNEFPGVFFFILGEKVSELWSVNCECEWALIYAS